MFQNISDYLRIPLVAACLIALPLFSSEFRVDPVRDAVVRIDNFARERYLAMVSFVPVRLFAADVNDEINSGLAINYAFDAMSLQLNKRNLKATVNHSRKVSQDGDKVSYRVSLSNVRVEQSSEKVTSPRLETQSSVFNRKNDYEKIIAAIKSNFERRSRQIMQKEFADLPSLKRTQKELDSCSDDARKLWKQCQDAVVADLLLFSGEAEALKKKIEEYQNLFQQQYHQYKLELDESEQAFMYFSRFQSATLSRKFAGLLASEPLLCESGGAQLVYTPQGTPAVVAIAGVDASGDLSLIRKKAMLRAMEQLLQWKYGSRMTSLVEKTTVITTVKESDGREHGRTQSELKRVLRNFSEGQIRSLPLVGYWYSQDRKIFYVAIGKIMTER